MSNKSMLVRATVLASAATAITGAAGFAETLEERVARLEAAAAAAPSIKSASGFDLTFYGYVKADVMYDNNYDLASFGFATLELLPVSWTAG